MKAVGGTASHRIGNLRVGSRQRYALEPFGTFGVAFGAASVGEVCRSKIASFFFGVLCCKKFTTFGADRGAMNSISMEL